MHTCCYNAAIDASASAHATGQSAPHLHRLLTAMKKRTSPQRGSAKDAATAGAQSNANVYADAAHVTSAPPPSFAGASTVNTSWPGPGRQALARPPAPADEPELFDQFYARLLRALEQQHQKQVRTLAVRVRPFLHWRSTPVPAALLPSPAPPSAPRVLALACMLGDLRGRTFGRGVALSSCVVASLDLDKLG